MLRLASIHTLDAELVLDAIRNVDIDLPIVLAGTKAQIFSVYRHIIHDTIDALRTVDV